MSVCMNDGETAANCHVFTPRNILLIRCISELRNQYLLKLHVLTDNEHEAGACCHTVG